MGAMSNVVEDFSRTPGAPCQPSASASREALGEISPTELGTFSSLRLADSLALGLVAELRRCVSAPKPASKRAHLRFLKVLKSCKAPEVLMASLSVMPLLPAVLANHTAAPLPADFV